MTVIFFLHDLDLPFCRGEEKGEGQTQLSHWEKWVFFSLANRDIVFFTSNIAIFFKLYMEKHPGSPIPKSSQAFRVFWGGKQCLFLEGGNWVSSFFLTPTFCMASQCS